MNFHINKRTDSGEMVHVPLKRDWFIQSSKPGFQLVPNGSNEESSRTYLGRIHPETRAIHKILMVFTIRAQTT